MAKIGEKRQAEKQIVPDDVDSDDMSPATPTTGLPVLFRPSSLSSAASNLTTYTREQSSSSSSSTPLQLESPNTLTSLKFTTPQIITQKPFDVNGTISSTMAFNKRPLDNGDTNVETSSKRSNLFMTCLEETTDNKEDHKKEKGFVFGRALASRVVNAEGQTALSPITLVPQKGETNNERNSRESEDGFDTSTGNDTQSPSPAFQGHPSHVLLPTVETVTGEEGERHVTQISCKLFVFDSSSHNWREKGRGELRLNDAPQSDGVYQSRLIMRAIGSYRVLLNTHLWSKMKCEKANQRTIRITAQENEGGFGVYIIKAAPKDIHQLHTAIDQRLDALQKSNKQDSPLTSKTIDNTKSPNLPPSGSFDEDDSELGDRTSIHSSPESSPERQMERLGNPVTTSSFPAGAPIIVPPPCSSSHSLLPLVSSSSTSTGPFAPSKDAVSFASVVSDPVVSSSDPIVTDNNNKN